MRKAGGVFLGAFLLGGAAVAWLAAVKTPGVALVAGIVTLAVHWWLSSTSGDEADQADASYFLGFLLTLVLLATGLLALAATPAATPAAGLHDFLYDLGVGLVLTIGGLAIR